MDEIRKRVKEIESKIITITGDCLDRWSNWTEERTNRDTVDDLLMERCTLLNSMFVPTARNMARFHRVNDHLYTMTQRLHSRIAAINAQADSIANKHVFDDDEEIEGWLRVVFNDETSVLKLNDDDYYSSKFALMIKILTELYDEMGLSDVEYSDNGINTLNDGTSWMDTPFHNWPEFNDIIICHAVHDLTNHKSFSVPDLLRLNDFLCEVQIKFQSITRQDGTRYKKDTQ